MKNSLFYLIFLTPFFFLFEFHAEASPTGPLIKHLSSFLKWTLPSPKPPQTDENFIQFENGYLVDTVVEGGSKLGVEPYSIRVSHEGELFAVDAVNSNIVKITPPLSQYSRARLVAGSFQGHSGHVDGRPSDARFNHPKGVTMDDKGNVYVADTLNLAIRKIGEAGVTTIAGGKSNVAGYMDGPSEDAKFSTNFDVIYVRRTCSLLVVDRGNAALRQISLHQEDCENQDSSISSSDIIMVVGAVLVGYASCMLQHGFGPSFSLKLMQKHATESELQDPDTVEKATLLVETLKDDPVAGWPSFGQLLVDLSKLIFEALGSIFLYYIPLSLRPGKYRQGLSPIKDTLVMPEDNADPPPLVQKVRSPSHETPHAPNATDYTQQKPQKSRTAMSKDPSLTSKHRSSKKQDISELRGSPEAPQYSQSNSKSQKDRSRHRYYDKSGDVVSGATGAEPKPIEMKSVDYDDPKFDHYNIRSKRSDDDLFHF